MVGAFWCPCGSEKSHLILPLPRKDTLYWPVQTSDVLQLPISHHGDNVVRRGHSASLAYVRGTFRFKNLNFITVTVN